MVVATKSFLTIACVLLFGGIAAAATASTRAAPTTRPAAQRGEPNEPPVARTPAEDPNRPAQATGPRRTPLQLLDNDKLDDGDPENPLLKMLVYSVLILVLGGVAIFVVKRVLPRVGVAPGPSRRVQVLETAHISPRKSVVAVRAGSRMLLLASTRDELRLLADITDAWDAEPAEPEQPESPEVSEP
jgi:flagellar biogenesis protein FliO